MIYNHKKTGKQYHKINEIKMKVDLPEPRWVDAVLYQSYETQEQFCCSFERWMNSFE